MNESATVNMTINGQPVAARPGQTVMQAASAAGIDIPGLCHHAHLKAEGCCRICLVEIEKQRALQPACTFPASDGLVVRTETPKVVEARKFALQMLFSERSHYCMFCPSSGSAGSSDCELQRLGYRYGLDSWMYAPDYRKSWPMDTTRRHFVMDHSRCILCRRCVRACSQIAANYTLGVHQRGARTMVCADDDLPFGKSSCISCGSCLQVCPTGALTDRFSAFCGHERDITRTPAVCMGCSAGCGIEAVTRDNQLLRVEGDWKAANHGLLCTTGRFEVVEPKPARILNPLVRRDGRLVESDWEKALSIVMEKVRQANTVAGLISPRLPTESLAAFAWFFQEVLKSNEVALLYGEAPPLEVGRTATLADVAAADCVVVIGGDPTLHQKVLAQFVKRAFNNDAQIVVINNGATDLDRYAHLRLQLDDISYPAKSPFERLRHTYHLGAAGLAQLKTSLTAAKRPVVLYGSGLTTTVYTALRSLPGHVRFLPLVRGTNTAGAAKLGLSTRAVRGDVLYMLLGDDVPQEPPLPARGFTIVQAAYRGAWTEAADVVLPAQIWSERKGHIRNIEDRRLELVPLTAPPASVRADWEPLLELSNRMGHGLSFEEIAAISSVV
jgi:formate dehydrogenase major subunit